MRTYDAIVVGAGIAGLSVAWELAKRRQKVLVLERENPGGKTSRRAAGILDPYGESGEETSLHRLTLEAFEGYPEFVKEISRRSHRDLDYAKLGMFCFATSAEDEKELRERFLGQKGRRLPVELLSKNEIRKMEPLISSRIRMGLFYPEIPKLSAEKLTDGLLRSARKKGVEIKTSVKHSNLWQEREKVRGMKIGKDSIEARSVIFATGCWGDLYKRLGLKVSIRPVRGQILLLRSKPSLYPRHILRTVHWAYIVPWPQKRLLVGSTFEIGESNARVTQEGKKDILNRAGEMMEGLDELRIESSWAGLRPYAGDGMPVIGPTKISGLYLATGYYRSGVLIGPFVGKLLAEGIVTGRFSPLLRDFYPK